MSDLAKKLSVLIDRLALPIVDEQLAMLVQYVELFHKWNKAYNLSAIRDLEGIVHRHIIDSLSICPFLPKTEQYHIIDVGTGGGLPGIPLAIMNPGWQVSLLDSNGKKTRFLTQVKIELGLANVSVFNERVEKHQPAQPLNAVISRAFASLKDMIEGCRTLLDDKGVFWAMKGVYPEQEIAEMPAGFVVKESFSIHLPDDDASRHLLAITKNSTE